MRTGYLEIRPGYLAESPVYSDSNFQNALETANRALGRLDALLSLVPEASSFHFSFLRKEALASCFLTGPALSLQDLLLAENDPTSEGAAEVGAVARYVGALDYGLVRVQKKGVPLSARLLEEMHAILAGSRAPAAAPSATVSTEMGRLDSLIANRPLKTPTVLKAAMACAQMQTIRPFGEETDRMSRLLIPLILCAERALTAPVLYLSVFFRRYPKECEEHVRLAGTGSGLKEWLLFYLRGIETISAHAVGTAQNLIRLFEDHRRRIRKLGKAAPTALRLHELLKERVVVSLGFAQKQLQLSFPTVSAGMRKLERLGLARELTGRKKNRFFSYQPYLDNLDDNID